MTIPQSMNVLVSSAPKQVTQNSETPDFTPETTNIDTHGINRHLQEAGASRRFRSLVANLVILENSRQEQKSTLVTCVAYEEILNFIATSLTTKKYDVSKDSSIMKTASRKVVEPFLEKLLSDKNLRRPLSTSLLDPLPTVALWGFHRYAQTGLAEFNQKFIKATGVSLVPLIEAALKERGLDVNRLPDIDCKEPLLKVLRNEYDSIFQIATGKKTSNS